MKFYISAKGIKRVIAISEKPTSTAAGGRRISAGVFLPAVVFVGILLPFLFLRIAFLVLESAALCSSLGITIISNLVFVFFFSPVFTRLLFLLLFLQLLKLSCVFWSLIILLYLSIILFLFSFFLVKYVDGVAW